MPRWVPAHQTAQAAKLISVVAPNGLLIRTTQIMGSFMILNGLINVLKNVDGEWFKRQLNNVKEPVRKLIPQKRSSAPVSEVQMGDSSLLSKMHGSLNASMAQAATDSGDHRYPVPTRRPSRTDSSAPKATSTFQPSWQRWARGVFVSSCPRLGVARRAQQQQQQHGAATSRKTAN